MKSRLIKIRIRKGHTRNYGLNLGTDPNNKRYIHYKRLSTIIKMVFTTLPTDVSRTPTAFYVKYDDGYHNETKTSSDVSYLVKTTLAFLEDYLDHNFIYENYREYVYNPDDYLPLDYYEDSVKLDNPIYHY